MANFIFNAQARAEDKQGKGASRRLRRESLVPAIIYGGNAEPVSVTLELRELVKALESNAFFEEVVELLVWAILVQNMPKPAIMQVFGSLNSLQINMALH